MTRHNLFPMLAVAVILLAVGSSFAQTTNVIADVPFAFSIGDQSVPAGHYELQSFSGEGILALRRGNEHMGLVSTHSIQSATASGGRLIFQRYGDRYFLRQIWMPGSNSGRELPTTKLEKELASNRTTESLAVLASK
jgi:hypothetical protein